MKIAAVTDDNETISLHVRIATKCAVLEVDQGQIVTREIRERIGYFDCQREGINDQHQHHGELIGKRYGQHSGEIHWDWFRLISDCNTVVSRGMDQRTYFRLRCMGIQPIITDIPEIKKAVQAVIDETIQNHLDRLD
jgi:hypothetical protein